MDRGRSFFLFFWVVMGVDVPKKIDKKEGVCVWEWGCVCVGMWGGFVCGGAHLSNHNDESKTFSKEFS